MEGVVSSETLTPRLSPEISRLVRSSRIRRIGTRWLWRRQSQISWKWIGSELAFYCSMSSNTERPAKV